MSNIALGGGRLASEFLVWLSRAVNDNLSIERRQANEWLTEGDAERTSASIDLEEIDIEQVTLLQTRFTEHYVKP